MNIWIFKAGNGPKGHMMAPLGMTQGTVAFVKVKSLDLVIKKATKYGGRILVPRFEVPGLGSFAYLKAPGGTVHAAFESTKQKGRK